MLSGCISISMASLRESIEIINRSNSDKPKQMAMSPDQNAGRSHIIKTENSSSERMAEFKYLGTTLTNQNSFRNKL